MSTKLDQRLFRGLSIYQDVVVAGRTLLRGSRDCPSRWQAIAPVLSDCRTVLDVGSNFGWFGLKFCELKPEGVVASVEADLRSARVQRRVLQSHDQVRICLLTRPATSRAIRALADHGQRFDAVLCLSVLHWVREHRPFVDALGRIGSRLIFEHPDPTEIGAGIESVRREIGPIGPYLARCFPTRPVRCLGQTQSHLQPDRPREVWLVEPPREGDAAGSLGLIVPALLRLGVSWPPRRWWMDQLGRHAPLPQSASTGVGGRLLFTHQGIETEGSPCTAKSLRTVRRRIKRIPEQRCLTPREWVQRRCRSIAGRTVRLLTAYRRV